ncbi:phosphodiester glycosidase family protein [Paenibacillus sp. CAU 1782]
MAIKKRGLKKKLLLSLGGVLLAVAAVLYLLADRYLIEHVELVVTPPSFVSGADSSAGGSSPTGGDNSAEGSAAASGDNSTGGSAAAGENGATEGASTGAQNSTPNTAESSGSGNQNPGQKDTGTSSGSIVQDDWNYASDDISIAIRQVQEGTGDDQITYYVADVKLSDLSSLRAAFAKNSFGRNIIETTSTIAENNGALFAINGDYYGFRDDGVIIRNGTLYRDEPARDAMAIFGDGSIELYNENEVSSQDLLARQVLHTYSFGPALVLDGKAEDGLDKVTIDSNFGNRSIENANPRTGFGMIEPGHYLFVVVDGRSRGYSRGMTLNEFADLFVELGASEAYNLDGGGSSTMYFNGRVVNQPSGKEKERGVSDILYVAE